MARSLVADPLVACERAARQAERDWSLPKGLLAAIGLVESGRRAPDGSFSTIWPWTINAEGLGYHLPGEDAAVGTVRALQRRGVRMIDVGCFQVDLFYHPDAFASLEEAFDPDANARAAARILSLERLGSTGWDGAIGAYHSAVPLLGAAYLQKVRGAWHWTVAHPSWGEPVPPEAYAVLLSPQARLVRVVTPFESSLAASQHLPHVVPTGPAERGDQTAAVVKWLHELPEGLPRVLTSSEAGSRLSPATTAMERSR
jgi:hypothetical protein